MGAQNDIDGRIHGGELFEQAAKVQLSEKSGKYTANTFSLANAAEDSSLKNTIDTDFFDFLQGKRANYIEIRTTQEITVKFRTLHNATIVTGSLPAVKLAANALRLLGMMADVTDMFFSNSSGSSATVDIVAI